MDHIKESIETLRKENDTEKLEIISFLNELLNPVNREEATSINVGSSKNTFFTELLRYEQKVNHKLTEIKYDLKKFLALQKPPVYQPEIPKVETEPGSDIESIKDTTLKLLTKLDKLCVKEEEVDVIKSEEVKYPYISKDTLDLLSDHTKTLLNNLSEHTGEFECFSSEKFTQTIGKNDEKLEEIVSPFLDVITKDSDELNVKQIGCLKESDTKSGTDDKEVDSKVRDLLTGGCLEEFQDSLTQYAKDVRGVSEQGISEPAVNPGGLSERLPLPNRPDSVSSEYYSVDEQDGKNIAFKMNNVCEEICDEYISPISDTDTDKGSGRGYSIESDHDMMSTASKKKKKHKVKTVSSPDTLKDKNLKDSPGFHNNLEDAATPTICKVGEANLKNCNQTANQGKPAISLEEKIKKLGLQDRRTVFESTMPVATLPDLRLQSTFVEKLNVKVDNEEIEVMDRVTPEMCANCVFSHIESPDEFYIHLDDEESRLIDALNDYITENFKKTKTPFPSKLEAFKGIGRFCCAYVKDYKMYYRAEIIDWLFGEKENKLVLVQLIDYGCRVIVHFKNLRKLTKELSMMPRIAVKCFLPMLYPPGSTKTNILKEWPTSSIDALKQLCGLSDTDKKVYFRIFFVQKEEDSIGVDMYALEDSELDTVGQILINLGHAVQIILPTDDPLGLILDDEEITRMEDCNNINEAVLGYDPKDETRICKFTRKDGTCFKGNHCKLEHVQFTRGGFTTDKIPTYAGALNDVRMPKVGEQIRIRFTVFMGASHYFVNLMDFVDNLSSLEDTLNTKSMESSFEKYKIMPAYGEIVLVKHWTKKWLRAKVRHHSFDEIGNCTGVQVFMVDYGDIIDVSLRDVRHIRKEFLELPFQAIECVIYKYKTRNDAIHEEIDKFFYDNMVFRPFDAKVLGVSDMLLCLSVFHKDEDLGSILEQKGFLTRVNSSFFPLSSSIVIPG